MTDANSTIGILQGVIEASNTVVYSNLNANTTSTTVTSGANSEFTILVYGSTSTFRGNTEAVFYGGMAAQTTVSYQLVDG